MWSVMLGPTNQAVPLGLWEEFRDKDWIFVWDVYCKRYGGDTMHAYHVMLRRWDSNRKEQRIDVGHTIKQTRLGESWNAFGSSGWPSVDGFATRRYAIEYMLRQNGYTKRDY